MCVWICQEFWCKNGSGLIFTFNFPDQANKGFTFSKPNHAGSFQLILECLDHLLKLGQDAFLESVTMLCKYKYKYYKKAISKNCQDH